MNLTKMVISEDEDRIMIDGKEYISVKKVIDDCVELCIRYSDDTVVTVYETESNYVDTFETLFRMIMEDDRLLAKFQDEYIRRRFIDRQTELH